MGPLEIIFICLGVVVVVASFLLSDKIWGNDEDKDIKEQKAQLTEEMNKVFDEHVKTAEGKIEEAAKAALQSYVEEARREIQVVVNEAKEEIEKLTLQAQEKMEACVKQTQEETQGISKETKESLEAITGEQQKKIQECTEQVISKINNHHSEVTLLYSMLDNKQSEIKKEVELVEQARCEAKDIVCEAKDVVAEMESVKKQADVISQSAGDIRDEFISEIKEELIHELATEDVVKVVAPVEVTEEKKSEEKVVVEEKQPEEVEYEPTKPIDAEEIKEVLHAMGQDPAESQLEEFMTETEATINIEETDEPEVVVADVEEIEEISVQTVKSGLEEVLDEVSAEEVISEKNTEEVISQEIEEDKADVESVEEAEEVDSESAEETDESEVHETVEANEVETVEEDEELPEDIVVEEAPNKLLRAVRESGTVSTEADFAMRKKVLAMYEKGHSSMEIAQAVNLGIGEVRMIVDLYSRRER